ncbi:MAG: hypothetical protein LBF59_00780 [Prevotellaceae bacterium]|jgi:hypothetical protein|nr:hypothetical protein [Prevotellaceae bacterium]
MTEFYSVNVSKEDISIKKFDMSINETKSSQNVTVQETMTVLTGAKSLSQYPICPVMWSKK